MSAKTSPKFDYYAWQTERVRVRGEHVQRCAKPGMAAAESPDLADLLLAESIEVHEGESVLVLNCSAGLAGLVAARESRGGQVWLADANAVATEAARSTLEANGIKGVECFTSSGTRELPPTKPFDVVTVRLPKGKQLTLQLLLDGYNALRPGGKLFFAGANDEGIKPHFRNLDLLFGSSVLLGFRKGCRVAMATKAEAPTPLPKPFNEPWLDHGHVEQMEYEHVSESAGKQILVCSRPGVFSWSKLDQGTAMLLDHMEVKPTDTVLDIGCGNGILGAVAAAKASEGRVVMLDADINAVDAARQTLSANGLTNGEVVLSDGIAQLSRAQAGTQQFDVVVTNPPFHQGKGTRYDIGVQFIADAASVLKDGGKLFVVANLFLKYEPQIDRHLGQCKTLFKDGRFKILRGIKNPKD